jgi:hypothetical protein
MAFRSADEVYVKGSPEDGPCEATEVKRGKYPESNGHPAYPLHNEAQRMILGGELMFHYRHAAKASDSGGCVTSSFNGFDKLPRQADKFMEAFRLTMLAYENFYFCGISMYSIQQSGEGAAIRSGVGVTKNNSGGTLTVGQSVCWCLKDVQNGKARAHLVTLTRMRDQINDFEKGTGTSIDPLLKNLMLTPIAKVMLSSSNGNDVKLLLFA